MNEALPLRDIEAAALPPWWPPAPGWWLLGLFVLGVLGAVAWWAWRQHRRRQLRRRLLGELAAVRERHGAGEDAAYLRAAADFLRRLLVHVGPHRGIAQLTGEPFARALLEPIGDDRALAGAARALAEDPYRPDPQVDRAALQVLLRRWIDHLTRGGAGR